MAKEYRQPVFKFFPGPKSQGQALRATAHSPYTSSAVSQAASVFLFPYFMIIHILSKLQGRAGGSSSAADLLSTPAAPGCSTGSNKNKLTTHIKL